VYENEIRNSRAGCVVGGEFKGIATERGEFIGYPSHDQLLKKDFVSRGQLLNNKQLAHIFTGNSVCFKLTILQIVVCDGSSEVK
jgi:hypothetical protein